jgi:LuxR family maltose regulon positive regulatory protein
VRLLPTHLSLGEIGDRLHITRNTVKGHVAAVYRKLQASNRAEVVVRARELGLLS